MKRFVYLTNMVMSLWNISSIIMDQMQPRSQGSLLPALRPSRSVGRVGENPGNEVGPNEDP